VADHLDVLITASVEGELAPFISMIPRSTPTVIGKRPFVRGTLFGCDVGALITGPGLVNTAQAMTAVIEQVKPCLIIHTGCAGFFKESGMTMGDIGVADSETDIHLGIESDNTACPEPLPFSILETALGDITGHYPLNHTLGENALGILSRAFAKQDIRIQKGCFITVSTITSSDLGAEKLYTAYSPLMESMEGSAAAHVAHHYHIPFLEIRSASNRVGKRDKTLWDLPLAFERCSLAVSFLIKHISELR